MSGQGLVSRLNAGLLRKSLAFGRDLDVIPPLSEAAPSDGLEGQNHSTGIGEVLHLRKIAVVQKIIIDLPIAAVYSKIMSYRITETFPKYHPSTDAIVGSITRVCEDGPFTTKGWALHVASKL